MSWSISTSLALETKPQVSVTDCPAVIVVAEAANDAMLGVPLHPVGGVVGVGVDVRTGVGAPGTLMFTVSVAPNNPAVALFMRH